MAVLMQAFLGMGSVSEPRCAWGQLRREARIAAGSGASLGGGEARGVLGLGAAAGPSLPSTRSLKRTCCVRLRRRRRRLSMSGESRLSSTERTVMAFSWPPSPAGTGLGRGSRLTMAQGPGAAALWPGAVAGQGGRAPVARAQGCTRPRSCPGQRAASSRAAAERGRCAGGRGAAGHAATARPYSPRLAAPAALPAAGSPHWRRLPMVCLLSVPCRGRPMAPGAGCPCPWLLAPAGTERAVSAPAPHRSVSPPESRLSIPHSVPLSVPARPLPRWPVPRCQPCHHQTRRDKL